jgi:glucosamine 6-phosphate synthetase-like amidotransferase/phosphosugar isomerase protein
MAYPFGEFMHGHVAVLNHKAAVITIIDEENEISAKRNIQKIKNDYNPLFVGITSVQNTDCDERTLYIKTSKKIKAIFGSLITLQLIACEIASVLKRNPDEPRGLKKVVLD